MIGWLVDALRVQILAPQADMPAPGVGELDRRAHLDEDLMAVNLDANTIELIRASTVPVGTAEIGPGGSVTLRHTIAVGITVIGGDRPVSERTRDAIVGDILLRFMADPALGGVEGEGQYIEHADLPAIDWTDLADVPTNAYATLTFTFDCDWER